ncbi:MAG: LamG domain-containing protein [Planctomycetaceae bacterium]|nr:LamG domain-containing protein [Planctomycetaceae bacterium]
MREQNVAPLIDDGLVDEVWIFSDHFFGLWEASMAGPRSFFINGGVYPQVPTQRPFAFYGFNYERAVAEMAHNTSHRTEATMNRIYGGWNLKAPSSNWDRFSANHDQSGGVAGVGTCHWPPNAKSDYDYEREVLSWADDFLDYPHLDGQRQPVSAKTWNDGDAHRGYMRWYFAHVPRTVGTNDDGRQNNWWKYLYDFDNYTAKGEPKPPQARLQASDLYEPLGQHVFKVAYQSPTPIEMATLGDDDIVVTGPGGFRAAASFMAASDKRNGTHRVAAYRVAAPSGGWSKSSLYSAHLQGGAVKCTSGQTFETANLGSFVLRSTEATGMAADEDTLVLLKFDETLAGHRGQASVNEASVERPATPFGRGAHFSEGSVLAFLNDGNLKPAEGTVEFWIKPDWDGTVGTGRELFKVGEDFNFGLLIQIDGANNLRLMVWGEDSSAPDGKGNKEMSIGASTTDWKAGQWHHVAATWNMASRELVLYVDGRQVAMTNQAMLIKEFSRPRFTIGSGARGVNPAHAVIDEVCISGRARTGTEIAAAFDASPGLGKLSIEPAELTLDVSQRLALRVFADSGEGLRREVTRLVRWSIDQPEAGRLDRHGNLVATRSGDAMVTASLAGMSASCKLQVTGDAPPLARLVRGVSLPRTGRDTLELEVEFIDQRGIVPASLDASDIRIIGPSGFHQFAELKGHELAGSTVVATYELRPPTGGWQASPAGKYVVEMKAWQVHTADGRFVPESVLGAVDRPGAAAGTGN